jgi:hypothetical protein
MSVSVSYCGDYSPNDCFRSLLKGAHSERLPDKCRSIQAQHLPPPFSLTLSVFLPGGAGAYTLPAPAVSAVSFYVSEGSTPPLIFFAYSGGWSPNWVHRGHLLSYCACPGWLWGWRISRWNADWQGKPKYSEITCPSATLSTTKPTWPDPGSNPGRCGGKPATDRLSYGAAQTPPLSSIFDSSQPTGKPYCSIHYLLPDDLLVDTAGYPLVSKMSLLLEVSVLGSIGVFLSNQFSPSEHA